MMTIDVERNNAIAIIAKDTGTLIISVDGYTLGEGDKLTFTVNRNVELQNPLIQKVIEEFDTENNYAVISLSQKDTDLEPGLYVYDIQLDTVDGQTDTIVGPSKFKVIGGATY